MDLLICLGEWWFFGCWLLLELVAVNLFVLIARLSCAGCLDCLRWFVLMLVLLDELA